jgi:hypothetical protein
MHTHLLGAHQHWNEALWLRSLGCLVNENMLEAEPFEARVASTHACAAHHLQAKQSP